MIVLIDKYNLVCINYLKIFFNFEFIFSFDSKKKSIIFVGSQKYGQLLVL